MKPTHCTSFVITTAAALFATISFPSASFASTQRAGAKSSNTIIASSGKFSVSESELAVFQFPKIEGKSSAPTEALEREARRTASESLLRLKAVEASDLSKRTTKSERAWLDLSSRIARASALLDLEEIRALSSLNQDPKALRERAYENYLANPARFSVPTTAEVSVLLVNPAEVGFDNAVKAIAEAQSELTKGRDFDEVASKYSKASVGRTSASVRLTVSPQETEPTILGWVFKDAKPGEVFGPYVVGGMFSMVKFHSRKPPYVRPFEQVADEEIDRVRKSAAATARSVLLDKLLPSPIIHVDSLAPVTGRGAK